MDVEEVVIRLASVGNGWGLAWLWYSLNGVVVPDEIVCDLKEELANLAAAVSPYIDEECDD